MSDRQVNFLLACFLATLLSITEVFASTGTLILDNKTHTNFMLISYHGFPSLQKHRERLAAGARRTLRIDLSPDSNSPEGTMRVLLYVEGTVTQAVALELVADGDYVKLGNNHYGSDYELKKVRHILRENSMQISTKQTKTATMPVYDKKKIHLVVLDTTETEEEG